MRTAGCLVCLLLTLAAAACNEGPGAGMRYHGLVLAPARAKPAFRLTATDGQPYSFRSATEGQLTLLFFGYTHCPDVCPVHLTNLAALLDKLPYEDRERVRVVFVTTDPARDSLARLREWLDNFSPRFVGLRGELTEVNRIQAELGLPAAAPDGNASKENGDYTVGHAAQILAFTPDDSLRVLYPFGVRQADWAADIPRLLTVR